jgi:hypothetical protein
VGSWLLPFGIVMSKCSFLCQKLILSKTCLPIKQWIGLAHFHDFLDSNIRNTQKNLLQYSFKSTISKGCKKENLLSIEAQLYLE